MGANDDDGGGGVGGDGGNSDGDQGCRSQTSERSDDQRREPRIEQGTSCSASACQHNVCWKGVQSVAINNFCLLGV